MTGHPVAHQQYPLGEAGLRLLQRVAPDHLQRDIRVHHAVAVLLALRQVLCLLQEADHSVLAGFAGSLYHLVLHPLAREGEYPPKLGGGPLEHQRDVVRDLLHVLDVVLGERPGPLVHHLERAQALPPRVENRHAEHGPDVDAAVRRVARGLVLSELLVHDHAPLHGPARVALRQAHPALREGALDRLGVQVLVVLVQQEQREGLRVQQRVHALQDRFDEGLSPLLRRGVPLRRPLLGHGPLAIVQDLFEIIAVLAHRDGHVRRNRAEDVLVAGRERAVFLVHNVDQPDDLTLMPYGHAEQVLHSHPCAEEVVVQLRVVISLLLDVGDVDKLTAPRRMAHEAVLKPPTVVLDLLRHVAGLQVAPHRIHEHQPRSFGVQHLA
mmetsp:Transcript_78047/g.238730  ORF Transcript_78047/g.238730 Transcript_78047/m.238730 type:complete len:381 (-) Transcript_78047:490-1632(-)